MIYLLLALLLAVSLFACGGEKASDTPPDLTGEWKQNNSNSEDTYQTATITADTITIYWVTNNGDTKSLYWAGSFTPPTTAADSYSWESVNDKEQTSKSLLASGADTKMFNYKDGEISYEASAMGTTTTVRLSKNAN